MRRRVDESVPPRELLVFDGHRYATPWEWDEAFDVFHAGRARWAREHGVEVAELPDYRVDGSQPWDDEYALGPVNLATHEVHYHAGGRIARISHK